MPRLPNVDRSHGSGPGVHTVCAANAIRPEAIAFPRPLRYTAAMPRLFVALRPPSGTRALLRAAMGGIEGARWQDDDQLHLTIRFIGEVDRRQAEDVALALSRASAPAPVIAIDGMGTFDRRGRIDTLWARALPIAPLAALHAQVDGLLATVGVARDDRKYLPHVTLARFGRHGAAPGAIERWVAANAGLATPAFTASHLILYESRLGKDGAHYEAVARWPLDPPTASSHDRAQGLRDA